MTSPFHRPEFPKRTLLPPLKHKRYPWIEPSKGGTITAGFVYSEGVLLCSDSQMETPGQKGDGRKIGSIVHEWGGIACALAGNVDYGTSAFQHVVRLTEKGAPTIAELETCLSDFYKEHVLAHPHYLSYPALAYSLLLGVNLGDGPKLYVTNETTLREVTSYRCEGIGRDVGQTVIKPIWRPNLDARSAMRLGAYMLAIVKQNVPGCGGPSQFFDVATFPREVNLQMDVVHLENVCGWFGQKATNFLLSHMTESEADFGVQLEELNKSARHIRTLWNEQVEKEGP